MLISKGNTIKIIVIILLLGTLLYAAYENIAEIGKTLDASTAGDSVAVIHNDTLKVRTINDKVWGNDLIEGTGTAPNIPYFDETYSLGTTLIEYSAAKTVFNQDIEADAMIIDEITLGNTAVGLDTLPSGTSQITVNCSGCTADDYIFIQEIPPTIGTDILPLSVLACVDSFVVYTDNADTLSQEMKFNWFRVKK